MLIIDKSCTYCRSRIQWIRGEVFASKRHTSVEGTHYFYYRNI